MSINKLNFIWINACVIHCITHRTTWTIHIRSCHVIGISTHAVTRKLCINFCTAFLSSLIFFKHHYTGTFANHKSIAVLIPRTTCCCRIVIATRQCARSSETTYSKLSNCSFRTTCNHYISVTVLNHTCSVTNRMCASCTSSHNRYVRTFKSKHNR